MILSGQGSIPVSYTHLDVYKRQCEGIAKSVKVLCDALGIWCMIAVCGNNPEKGIKYRHTWNIVKIGGTYYHLDATFDNTLGKHLSLIHI